MRSLADLSLDELPVLVTAANQLHSKVARARRTNLALLPGSFNPMHAGHGDLAAVAARLLNRQVAFELSVANVDKPELSVAETQRRCAQFAGHGELWITRAPQFAQKAVLFPGATFVVGADTALRLVEGRYYDDSDAQLQEALETLRRCGCRFLVAARADRAGRLLALRDVPIPSGYAELFDAIPTELFRCDISSTDLRIKQQPGC